MAASGINLGLGQVGAAAINEISEVIQALSVPFWTETTTETKGKTTIVTTKQVSKFDIILIAGAVFAFIAYLQEWWWWQQEEESTNLPIPEGAKSYNIATGIIDPIVVMSPVGIVIDALSGRTDWMPKAPWENKYEKKERDEEKKSLWETITGQ